MRKAKVSKDREITIGDYDNGKEVKALLLGTSSGGKDKYNNSSNSKEALSGRHDGVLVGIVVRI